MLYYSHVNEDSGIERKLLAEGDYPLVVAVAGSGERILALMDNESVKTILAVDVNKEALFLLELKIVMLTNLTAENYLIFIGHAKSEPGFRLTCFEKAKSHLTLACTAYWEQRIEWIEKGILNSGHFEVFIARVRPVVTRFMGKRFKWVLSDSHFQFDYFQQIKWKLLTWLFSKKWVYTLWGNKDVAFIGRGACPEHIPSALNFNLKNGLGFSSFTTHLIFNGHLRDMDELSLPPSMQKEVLTKIRHRIIKKEIHIEYHQKDFLELVKKQKDHLAPAAFYSVSDILSFENHNYIFELLKQIRDRPGNLMVIRAFLRNRLTTLQLNQLATSYKTVQRFDDMDSSRMYQVVAIKS